MVLVFNLFILKNYSLLNACKYKDYDILDKINKM